VPLGKFQSDVMRALAAQRSPDSYVKGQPAPRSPVPQTPQP
jgi:hypothetical protein